MFSFGLVVFLALIVVLTFLKSTRSPTNPLIADRWVFDLNQSTLVRATFADPSPYDTGSGNFDYGKLGLAGAGVDAAVFSCGECTDVRANMTLEQLKAVKAYIGFVSRLSPESVKVRADLAAGKENLRPSDTLLISDIAAKRWSQDLSGPALGLRAAALKPCPDDTEVSRCVPF